MSTTDVEWDTWFGDEIPAEEQKDEKYEFLKASPAEAKTFSREDQLYWVYGQISFKANYLLFGEKEDEIVEEEEEPDSESSEESESEESESEEEEEEESDDQPNSKESKRNDNRGYGPRGLVYPTTAV